MEFKKKGGSLSMYYYSVRAKIQKELEDACVLIIIFN